MLKRGSGAARARQAGAAEGRLSGARNGNSKQARIRCGGSHRCEAFESAFVEISNLTRPTEERVDRKGRIGL